MESGWLAQDTGRLGFASSACSTNKVQLGIPQTASTSVFYATLRLSIFISSTRTRASPGVEQKVTWISENASRDTRPAVSASGGRVRRTSPGSCNTWVVSSISRSHRTAGRASRVRLRRAAHPSIFLSRFIGWRDYAVRSRFSMQGVAPRCGFATAEGSPAREPAWTSKRHLDPSSKP